MTHCDESETLRIAQDLSAKYGADAVAFIEGRAARAAEVGDELAGEIWRDVLRAVAAIPAHRF